MAVAAYMYFTIITFFHILWVLFFINPYMVVFLFNAVIYVFLLFMSYIFLFYVYVSSLCQLVLLGYPDWDCLMYSYCMFMYLHCASWFSWATPTEIVLYILTVCLCIFIVPAGSLGLPWLRLSYTFLLYVYVSSFCQLVLLGYPDW